MTRFNRRNILKATAVSGSGLAALAYSPKPTLAASGWTVNSPSEVANENGDFSALEIPASGFSFSLDYSGLGSGSHSIDFILEAKLASDSSFDTVFSDSFSVEGDSGSVTESKLSTSFPVDLLANTSMSASDFAEPNSGDTEVTTVDLRVSFNWSEGENSASSSSTSQFDVNVTHAADPALTANSLTVNDPPTVSNDSGELSSLELPKDDFSFSLDYNNFETGTHSINFQLEAKLSSASSFDTVFSETFDVSGESGTVSESELSTSFPVDLLANTSMSASDFEEPNAGETEVTTVDFRVSFDWSGSETSTSDSSNDSFDVTVENTSPTYTIIDFEDGNLNDWDNVSGFMSIDSSQAYSGSYSAHADAQGTGYSAMKRSFNNGMDSLVLHYRETGSGSFGGGYQLLDSNGNRVLGFGTSNPGWVVTDGSSALEFDSPGEYKVWIKVEVSTDYDNSEYTITFTNTSDGYSATTTRQMDSSNPITQIHHVNIGGSDNLADRDLSRANNNKSYINQWTDWIKYTPM